MKDIFNRRLACVFCMLTMLFSLACANNENISESLSPRNKQPSSQPELVGKTDPALRLATARVIEALDAASNGRIDALGSMVTDSGLHVFPPFACEPSKLERSAITPEALDRTFVVANCHEDDISKRPVLSWSDFFVAIENSKALTQTNRIVNNQIQTSGFNTGSSTRAEAFFPDEPYQHVVYWHLGTQNQNFRDWDQVGFVFDNSKEPLALVAIYHDFFSTY